MTIRYEYIKRNDTSSTLSRDVNFSWSDFITVYEDLWAYLGELEEMSNLTACFDKQTR